MLYYSVSFASRIVTGFWRNEIHGRFVFSVLLQFLLIFRKAAAGELEEDSGLHALARLSEIDVSTEGVKGAKSFFEAKVRSGWVLCSLGITPLSAHSPRQGLGAWSGFLCAHRGLS